MRRKQSKLGFKLVAVLLIIGIGLGGYFTYNLLNENKKEEQMINKETKILDTITEMLELNTIKYHYSNIIDIEKDKRINDIKLPFTEKSFMIRYEGIINGGVDIKDLSINIKNNKAIEININKVKIIDHYIKDDSMYVYDTKQSIFNKVEIQEVLDDISKYKKEYEEKLIAEGFLDEVKKSVESEIKVLLNNFGYEVVNINFMN